MNDPVIHHFHETAASFDSIYTGKKSPIGRYLDRLLRWDMVERLRKTAEVVKSFDQPSVIDIGAGSGRFFEPLVQAGAKKITAVEPAGNMVEIANRLIEAYKYKEIVEIIEAPWLDANIASAHDISIAIGFFDYIDDPSPSLKKARDLTTGAFAASFPKSGTVRAKIRKTRLSVKGCPTYYYTKSQIEKLLKDAGFSEWKIDSFGQLLFVVAKP